MSDNFVPMAGNGHRKRVVSASELFYHRVMTDIGHSVISTTQTSAVSIMDQAIRMCI
jgi:hypothetical protein